MVFNQFSNYESVIRKQNRKAKGKSKIKSSKRREPKIRVKERSIHYQNKENAERES